MCARGADRSGSAGSQRPAVTHLCVWAYGVDGHGRVAIRRICGGKFERQVFVVAYLALRTILNGSEAQTRVGCEGFDDRRRK